MIPVKQTKFTIQNNEGVRVQYGNCYAACIASILHYEITDVPNVEVFFNECLVTYADTIIDKFLELKGYKLLRFCIPDGCKQTVIEDEYYIVCGISPRTGRHAVIYKGLEMVHDPHPSNDGLLNYEEYIRIVDL